MHKGDIIKEKQKEHLAHLIVANFLLDGDVSLNIKKFHPAIVFDTQDANFSISTHGIHKRVNNSINALATNVYNRTIDRFNKLPREMQDKIATLTTDLSPNTNIRELCAYTVILATIASETPEIIKQSTMMPLLSSMAARTADIGTLAHNLEDNDNKQIFNSALGMILKIESIIKKNELEDIPVKLSTAYRTFSPRLGTQNTLSNFCVDYSENNSNVVQSVFSEKSRASGIKSMKNVESKTGSLWSYYDFSSRFF